MVRANPSSASHPTPSSSQSSAPSDKRKRAGHVDARNAGASAPVAAPKRPPTAKQLIANRLNARRSTGPQTAEGRARVRMNALRHGLCARAVLLPGEDWKEYQAFSDQLIADLQPVGVVQEMLAGRVAAIAWALQRLPVAAGDAAERGEQIRFDKWFTGRGTDVKLLHELLAEANARNLYAEQLQRWEKEGSKGPRPTAPPAGRSDKERMQVEITDAIVKGDPPPDNRDPCAVVASALVGDEEFAGVLKLEEHERRLWAALLSTLRALERRQRPPRDALRRDADSSPPRPVPADAPANVEMAQSGTSGPAPCEPPARNKPNSSEEETPVPAAPSPSQVPVEPGDVTPNPSGDVTDAPTAPAALRATPVVLARPRSKCAVAPIEPGGASPTGVRAERGEAGYDRPSP